MIVGCDYIVLMTSYRITVFSILLEKTQFPNTVRKQLIEVEFILFHFFRFFISNIIDNFFSYYSI